MWAATWAAAAYGSPQAGGDRPGYAGDGACTACHQEISQAHRESAHHRTSSLASSGTVAAFREGGFQPGKNRLEISDPANQSAPGLSFTMTEQGGRFFESATTGYQNEPQTRSERMDVVTGSGKRGQTYLYWQGDRLYELPISFWSEGSRWINSPGYQNGTANFGRPVQAGCLECHTTYIQPLSADTGSNRFVPESLVTGISCETCHGPGAEHVRLMGRPGAGSQGGGSGILNPKHFTRDSQVELCAVCHSGISREALAPPFSYRPGHPLKDYFRPLETAAVENHPDVHGNQVGLLMRSLCYRNSPSMSCATCHDAHGARQDVVFYSNRCETCHTWQSCGRAKSLGHGIANDCITCHMPVEPTNMIVSETAGSEARARMRNHWIKVYPGQAVR